jgi:acetyl esterase/lipase
MARGSTTHEAFMDYAIEPAVCYATHDGVKLLGDMYLPARGVKHPMVVAIHGGGWQIGERERYHEWGAYLASRGYGLFTIDYRLSTAERKTYPEAIHDCRAAVQFIRAEAARFNLDASRIALIGDSAGGHLASMVALAGDAPLFANGYPNDPHARVSTKAKAVVTIYGVHDLIQQWEHDNVHRVSDHITEKFLGVSLLDDPRRYYEASPLAYISRASNDTAFLIVHGTEDDIVDRGPQWDRYLTALTRAGYYGRRIVLQGAGHFWAREPLEEPNSYTGQLAPHLLRFFEAKL